MPEPRPVATAPYEVLYSEIADPLHDADGLLFGAAGPDVVLGGGGEEADPQDLITQFALGLLCAEVNVCFSNVTSHLSCFRELSAPPPDNIPFKRSNRRQLRSCGTWV
jgi:hypothetical protein